MNNHETAFVDAAQLPGVAVMDDKWFPVAGVLRLGGGYIPELDISKQDGQTSKKEVIA
ncbi:hypothetical protein [Oscillibacter sp.]|uniref:hypothetical protein n=1 Tax=Oscillibacter sp. TaxID=1945593 RepID=UPI00289A8EEA|nr:hypothetical protein [Oscillibacter sp.]